MAAIPRRILVVVILGLLAAQAGGQAPVRGVVFINTVPLGARVSLDGGLVPGQTPLLLRDLSAGRHLAEFEKQGYLPTAVRFELAAGEVTSVSVDLTGRGISSIYPEEKAIVVHGQEEAGNTVVYLDGGPYRVAREEGIVYLDPLFPQQRLIDALNISIPIMLTFASLLTVDAVFSPGDTDWAVPPLVLAAHGITLSMIGLDIGLNVYKRKQLRSYAYSVRSQELSHARAKSYYEEAERLLEEGRLEDALALHVRIIDSFPDSPLLPFSLYRVGGIHYLRGENEQAVAPYRRLAEDYPIPELYDKCRKNLADILFAMGRFEDSLHQLEQMVFADPLFERRQIETYRCEIFKDWTREDPSVTERSRACFEELVERYPELQDHEAD